MFASEFVKQELDLHDQHCMLRSLSEVTKHPFTMEPLEKRLAAAIGEIKSLICPSSTELNKLSSKVTNRSIGPSSYLSTDDKDNGVNWRTLLLRLYEELRKTEEKDEDNNNVDQNVYVVDSIGTLIVMIKDQLKKCLQSSSTTSTEDHLIVIDGGEGFDSASRKSPNLSNYITLTQNNVEVNEIWDSLVHSLQDLIIDHLVAANLDSPLEKEAFYHEMLLLDSLKDSSDKDNELFILYNSIRSQRIEKQLKLKPVDCFNLEDIVSCIKKWVTFDLELVDCYHLFHNQVTFHQIVTPYMVLVKNLLIERSPLKHSGIKPGIILNIINLLLDLDSFLSERDIQIPSENMSTSKDIHDIWDWRGYLVSEGIDNLLLRYLNQGLNDLMSSVVSINVKPETSHLTSINQSDNVLLIIYQIFKFLGSFESIELSEFKVSSKVIVNVTIVDFLQKTSEIWLNESTLPIESYYTLYNSFLYSQQKLDQHSLSNGKIDDVTNSLRSKIVSSHLSLLLFSYKSLDYIIIHMKKLSITMLNLIPYETQDESHIFVTILTLYMAHIVKIKIELSDFFIIAANLIDLLMPFTTNLETLFYKNFRDIHLCCWLLLVRAVFSYAPIPILHQELSTEIDTIENTISTNEETIKQIKKKPVNTFSSSSKSRLSRSLSPLPTPSSRHWSNLFDLYVETIPRPSTAFLVSLQRKRPQWSVVIRPFLESRLSFSINVFNHLKVTPENEEKSIIFLSNLITIACLNESHEKSVSYLLSPIIQRNEDWRWLDITKVTTNPKPWWCQALHKVIDETVSKFVQAVLIPIAYRYLLKATEYKLFYDEAGLNERYAEYDETFLIDEASKSLLSTIPTIMETLPFPLIASLEDMKNIKLITIKTLYNSLTAQIIFGSILRCLTESDTIKQTLTQNGVTFASRVAEKFEKMVIIEGKWPTMIKVVSKIVERRLSSKTNYVVASEADQFDLMDTLVSFDSNLQAIVESLYNFLVTNSSLLAKNGNLSKDQNFNLNFEPRRETQLTYNILEHCETIKKPKIDDITNDKWNQLIARVKPTLSVISIRQILSEREDLRYEKDEKAMELKKNLQYHVNRIIVNINFL